MKAKVKQINLPKGRRIIAISDIHGEIGLFLKLLKKVNFTNSDSLILLGDLYTKGPKPRETLKHIIELDKNPNVHMLRGNCDWLEDRLDKDESGWLENLPNIIDSPDYIFVHGGLTSTDLSLDSLEQQEAFKVMKNNYFMGQGLSFSKYVITGHWPCDNYCHEIPCFNPIINEERKIIAIDGGNVIRVSAGGQLNAFIIENGKFSFESVDNFPVITAEMSQEEQGGTLSITFLDRFVELIQDDGDFGIYKHLKTGKHLKIPKKAIWTDREGRIGANLGTDYFPPVKKGNRVSVIHDYGDLLYIKKEGTAGWLKLK